MARNASSGVDAVGEAPAHEGRDDLGVGGDLGGDAQAVQRLEVGVVVDVAVEGADDVGRVGRPARDLLGVQRVGVGLADDADARPPGVARRTVTLGVGRAQGEAQQLVVGDGGAEGPGVVAQLADLGRRLVDEAEVAAGRADGAAAEQGVALARRRAGRATPDAPRSSPWPVTSRCRPAESRPRTSRRSMADSATWIDVQPAMAAGPAPGPASSPTRRAVRRRSRWIAQAASLMRTTAALTASRAAAFERAVVEARPRARRARDHSGVDGSVDGRRQVGGVEQAAHAGHAAQQACRRPRGRRRGRPCRPRRGRRRRADRLRPAPAGGCRRGSGAAGHRGDGPRR